MKMIQQHMKEMMRSFEVNLNRSVAEASNDMLQRVNAVMSRRDIELTLKIDRMINRDKRKDTGALPAIALKDGVTLQDYDEDVTVQESKHASHKHTNDVSGDGDDDEFKYDSEKIHGEVPDLPFDKEESRVRPHPDREVMVAVNHEDEHMDGLGAIQQDTPELLLDKVKRRDDAHPDREMMISVDDEDEHMYDPGSVQEDVPDLLLDTDESRVRRQEDIRPDNEVMVSVNDEDDHKDDSDVPEPLLDKDDSRRVECHDDKRPDRKVMMPIEDDDEAHLARCVQWLKKRERLSLFDDPRNAHLYKSRQDLLTVRGRELEYSHFAFLTKWDRPLLGDVGNREFNRLLFDNGLTKDIQDRPSRQVNMNLIRVPTMSCDSRDRLIRRSDEEGQDLPLSDSVSNACYDRHAYKEEVSRSVMPITHAAPAAEQHAVFDRVKQEDDDQSSQ